MKPEASRMAARGFTLLELALVVALGATIVMGGLMASQLSQRIDQGRALGAAMLRLNDAVRRYKTSYRDQLATLPAQCSEATYAVGMSLGGPNLAAQPSPCQVRVHKLGVPGLRPGPVPTAPRPGGNADLPNGMQPTVADLIDMGLLESGFLRELVLPLDRAARVARADANGRPSTLSAGNTYGILIQRECAGPPVVPAPAPPCGTGADFDLLSLVFNLQPYRVDASLFGSGARLGAAIRAMDGQGYMSQVGGDGRLHSLQGLVALDNPIVGGLGQAGTVGRAGIIAAYHRWMPIGTGPGTGNTVDLDLLTHRDGSKPPTNHWDFNNKNLLNMQALAASGASIGKDTVYVKDPVTQAMVYQATGPGVLANTPFRQSQNQALLVKGDVVTAAGMGVYAQQMRTVGEFNAGTAIYAGSDVLAGADVQAGGEVRATHDVVAGQDLRSTRNVVAGANLSVAANMAAGANITAGASVAASGNLSSGGHLSVDGAASIRSGMSVSGSVSVTGSPNPGGSSGLHIHDDGRLRIPYVYLGPHQTVDNHNGQKSCNTGEANLAIVQDNSGPSSARLALCRGNRWHW